MLTLSLMIMEGEYLPGNYYGYDDIAVSDILKPTGVLAAGGLGYETYKHGLLPVMKKYNDYFFSNNPHREVYDDPDFSKKIIRDMTKDYKMAHDPDASKLNLRYGIKVKDPETGKIKIKFGATLTPDQVGASHYNYSIGSKTPYISVTPGTAYMAHELGHAVAPHTGIYSPEWSRKIALGMNKFSNRYAAALSAADAFNTGYNSSRSEDGKGILDYGLRAANLAGMASTAVQLGTEADASIRGLRSLHNVYGVNGLKFGTKALLPAFGTYATGALIKHGAIPLAAYGAGRLYGSLTNN